MRRGIGLVGVALVALGAAPACGGGGGGAGAQPPPPAPVDVGRTICIAECRRQDRCTEGGGGPYCYRRCDALVPRQPPAWRGDWANELAACVERAPCGHDAEEACVFAPSQRSRAAATCSQMARSPKAGAWCALLNGLLPPADAWSDGCLRSGRDVRECTPPLDWK